MFTPIVEFLRSLFRSEPGWNSQLEAYCRSEGVDPWALREALRANSPRREPTKPQAENEDCEAFPYRGVCFEA